MQLPLLVQVCGSAGDTTTLRSVEPPYSYSSKESRRAARQRAGIFAQLIEDESLEISNASPWPGGWQSRISAKNDKVCSLLSIASALRSALIGNSAFCRTFCAGCRRTLRQHAKHFQNTAVRRDSGLSGEWFQSSTVHL